MSGYTNNPTDGIVYSYQAADDLLQGRCKESRKLANNTYLQRRDGGLIAVMLHDTDIITINSDNSYTLTSGGWLTVTTKARLNAFSPASIRQEARIWYLSDGSLFYDGVIVDSDGLPVGESVDPTALEDKLKVAKKQAREYARNFVKALKAGSVPQPSSGDCWFCSMKTEESVTLGDATKNAAHIINHIEEGYFVPWLLVNAGREAGYRDEQLGLMGIGGHSVFINPEQNIYKYVMKRLQADITNKLEQER